MVARVWRAEGNVLKPPAEARVKELWVFHTEPRPSEVYENTLSTDSHTTSSGSSQLQNQTAHSCPRNIKEVQRGEKERTERRAREKREHREKKRHRERQPRFQAPGRRSPVTQTLADTGKTESRKTDTGRHRQKESCNTDTGRHRQKESCNTDTGRHRQTGVP